MQRFEELDRWLASREHDLSREGGAFVGAPLEWRAVLERSVGWEARDRKAMQVAYRQVRAELARLRQAQAVAS